MLLILNHIISSSLMLPHHTNTTLVERYGQETLSASAMYSTSGRVNKLERRILKSITDKTPFRIAILGGSYSLPTEDKNTYSFNVTRWMNAMLSSTTCRASDVIPLVHKDLVCRPLINDELNSFEKCPHNDKLFKTGPVFCGNFSNVEVETSFHLKKHRDEICDETMAHNKNRPCSVYGGSGPYATLMMGSKGGTGTSEGFLSIDTLTGEKFDLLIWDYGRNDVASMILHSPVVNGGFFEKAALLSPETAGFLSVYWFDGNAYFRMRYIPYIYFNYPIDKPFLVLLRFDEFRRAV
jgi:hypothetical protein